MKILVTGCNGQLGNEMQLLEAEHPQHTYFNTDVAELDITDQQAVEAFVSDNEIDGIVNCAAYTAVDKAEENQEFCTTLNTVAPAYLAAAVEKRGGWMIQISTDYVFDGTNYTPYVEADPVCPNSTYGRTKLAGEEAALKACAKTMIRLGKERSELGVIFDQIGTPTYARDLAVAIFAAIEQGVKPGVYHFSNEGVISWYDFTKAIHRIAGIKDCKVRPLHTEEYPTPANRPHYSVLDKTKIKQTYGIEIPYWEESLVECIKKLKD